MRGRIVTVEADVQSVEREIAAVNSSLKKQISQESRSELLHHRDQLYEQLKLLRQEKLLLLERLPPPASKIALHSASNVLLSSFSHKHAGPHICSVSIRAASVSLYVSSPSRSLFAQLSCCWLLPRVCFGTWVMKRSLLFFFQWVMPDPCVPCYLTPWQSGSHLVWFQVHIRSCFVW